MLASIEALTQVARRDAILVSEFNVLWSAAMDRMRQEPPAAASTARRDTTVKWALLLAAGIAFAGAARPTAAEMTPATIRSCIVAAAPAYHEPPAVLFILLKVEGGSLGAVSRNTNGTVDIGPMQVNQIWMPDVAAHWRADQRTPYVALRDNFCANVEAGAWILRHGLDEANGDFWTGVGYYHSHDPDYQRTYLRSVLAPGRCACRRWRALICHPSRRPQGSRWPPLRRGPVNDPCHRIPTGAPPGHRATTQRHST